ncbi:TerB family tellurite resistance protein [Ferrimonas kyonanensis]|uniref:tellurite resistance TerB family protein n=1 Tax=Ferrimonas kyonanensis TaxID=364763 RepID=UPI00041E393F|nr:TerB family tellurite resistance protein [Ferrimonas kyonanensis]
MISRFKSLFTDQPDCGEALNVELASTALLLEVARADSHISHEEKEAVWHLVKGLHQLSDREARELIEEALVQTEQANSIHNFTNVVKKNLKLKQKLQLVEGLWRVAYEDNVLEPHEEAMIRKVSDLLYLRHSEFIQTKLAVTGER